MANKKITETDIVSSINDSDFIFINQNNTLKQIKKSDIKKPTYTASEVGALPSSTTSLPNPNNLTILKGTDRIEYNGSKEIIVEIATIEELTNYLNS